MVDRVAGCAKAWYRVDGMGTSRDLPRGESVKEWYCFGRTLLAMDCEDRPFSMRFKGIYAECGVTPTKDRTLPRVDFRVAALPSDSSVFR